MANGRCRFHGGNAKRGAESGTYKHGRASKYLPTRLHGKYQEAVNDAELLSLRSDVALVSTRLGEVLEKLDTGESREAWGLLANEWSDFQAGWPSMTDVMRERALARISKLVADGLSETYVWNEARQLIRERASLVESERKRLVEMQQFIDRERAFLLIGAIVEIVQRHERDPRTLQSIADDIRALAAPGAGESASA